MSGLATEPLAERAENLKAENDHAHRMVAIALEMFPEGQRQFAAPVLWLLYAAAHQQGFNARYLEQMKAPR